MNAQPALPEHTTNPQRMNKESPLHFRPITPEPEELVGGMDLSQRVAVLESRNSSARIREYLYISLIAFLYFISFIRFIL